MTILHRMPDRSDLLVIPVEFATPEHDETVRLRYDILRKPLGLFYTEKDLAAEYDQTHLACYTPAFELCGCLVLQVIDQNVIKMRQVAVTAAHQNKGIGAYLVEKSEQWARKNGFKRMVLHARETAVPFYLKLNYLKVGNRFDEVGIPHFKMEKVL